MTYRPCVLGNEFFLIGNFLLGSSIDAFCVYTFVQSSSLADCLVWYLHIYANIVIGTMSKKGQLWYSLDSFWMFDILQSQNIIAHQITTRFILVRNFVYNRCRMCTYICENVSLSLAHFDSLFDICISMQILLLPRFRKRTILDRRSVKRTVGQTSTSRQQITKFHICI